MTTETATASTVLMIRPSRFCYNYETSLTNVFQQLLGDESSEENTQSKALTEFENLAHALKSNGVDTLIVNDSPEPHTPDSIFPNNWVSFHEDGRMCLYPMYAVNRRLERKAGVLKAIADNYHISETIDFSHYEQSNQFLEGTGSMVLDRQNSVAYACISPRTSTEIVKDFCTRMKYTPVTFHGQDTFGRAVYHTNVMMSVADGFAIVCLEAITMETERERLLETLAATGKEVIEIDMSQMTRFCGNVLQLQNRAGMDKILVVSSQAYRSFRGDQIQRLRKYNRIVHVNVETIEVNGGGSVRCMLAEMFLPKKRSDEDVRSLSAD